MSYGDRHSAGSLFKGRQTTTGTAVVELKSTPGAGYKYMIGACTVANRSAVATNVHLLSGTTKIWTFPAPPNNGGSNFAWPDPLDCEDNEALSFQADDAADIVVSVNGFRTKI